MRIKIAVFVFACFVARSSVNANPDGAPPGACVTMVPAQSTHGMASNEDSPYSVMHDAMDNKYEDDDITITVMGGTGAELKGVLCQVRKSDDTPIGTFTAPANYKSVVCGGNMDSAITHSNSNDKGMEAEFTWSPPGGNMGELTVLCTFLREKVDDHWVKVMAENTLMYMGDDGMDSGESQDEDDGDDSDDDDSSANGIYGYASLTMAAMAALHLIYKIMAI